MRHLYIFLPSLSSKIKALSSFHASLLYFLILFASLQQRSYYLANIVNHFLKLFHLVITALLQSSSCSLLKKLPQLWFLKHLKHWLSEINQHLILIYLIWLAWYVQVLWLQGLVIWLHQSRLWKLVWLYPGCSSTHLSLLKDLRL